MEFRRFNSKTSDRICLQRKRDGSEKRCMGKAIAEIETTGGGSSSENSRTTVFPDWSSEL